jgi:hypothetical protein
VDIAQIPTTAEDAGDVMSELKTEELQLTTADPASQDIAQKQPNEPRLVKAQAPETPNETGAVSEPMPLFTESETEDFRL